MNIKKYFFTVAMASLLGGSLYAGSKGFSENDNNSSEKPGDTANYVLMCFTNMSKPDCQVLAYRSCGDVMSNLDQSLIDEYGITCSDIM